MVTVDLDESQRQLVLMALALLSIERPGFDAALNEIALLMDNCKKVASENRGEMYDEFRSFRKP